MKDDPFGVRAGLSALDAAKAAGLGPLPDYLEEVNRVARQHEDFLASVREPAILREMRERDRRFAELARGYVGDLASQARLSDQISALGSATLGHRAFRNAAEDLAAGIPKSVRDDVLGWARGTSAYEAFQKTARDYVAGVSAPDWLAGFNTSAAAAGFDALGTLSKQALHGLSAADAGLLGGWDVAAQIGRQAEALGMFSAHETARKLFETVDLGPMNAAVRAVSEQVQARFGQASGLRSTDDLHALIQGLDVDGLRTAVERFTEATERSANEQNGRERREVERHRLMVVLALVAIIISALAAYFAYEQLQLQREANAAARPAAPSSTSRPVPKAHTAVSVRTRELALRLGPQTTQRTLLVLGQGQILPVLGRKVGWLRVRYVPPAGDGAGITGWVQAKYTTPLAVETMTALLCALVDEPLDGCSEED